MNTYYSAEAATSNVELTNNEQMVQESVSDEVYEFVADRLVNQITSRGNIKVQIMERWGMSEDTAEHVISEVETVMANMADEEQIMAKNNSTNDMIFGALWFIGGIIVTAVTYAAASGGGTYIIAVGAIIGGAIQFFKGLANKF